MFTQNAVRRVGHAAFPGSTLVLTRSHPIRCRSTFFSIQVSTSRYRVNNYHHNSPAPDGVCPPLPKSAALPDPTRKIFYAFDPANTLSNPTSSDLFQFLHPVTVTQKCALQHANHIDPPRRGVPWPTLFPGSLQSKFWVEAEETAAEFASELSTRRSQGVIDQNYINAAVDSAVHFSVNLIPSGNLTRTKILAKAYVLIFMHDDAIDSGNYDATIPNPDQKALVGNSGRFGYDMVAKEILAEDAVQGKRTLEGILSWGFVIQESSPESFSNLEEYMIYRAENSGSDPILRTAEFACGVHIPDYDTPLLQRLRLLSARHFLLVNDLYSYEKEALAEAKNGETMINAVRVVQNLMACSASSAKLILRQVIFDVEREMGEVYGRVLAETNDTSNPRLVYAQAMIAAAAGNLFFSATSPRYAHVVEGSKLMAGAEH